MTSLPKIVVSLLFLSLTVHGQIAFDDDGPPQRPPPQQNQNQFGQQQTARQQLPFLTGLGNLGNLPQQIGNLVNQFLGPLQQQQQQQNNNRQRPTQRPQPPPQSTGNCQTFQQAPGTCIVLRSCESLSNILRSVRRNRAQNILRQSLCGFSGDGPLVCCPGGQENFGGNNDGFSGGNADTFTTQPPPPPPLTTTTFRTTTTEPFRPPTTTPRRPVPTTGSTTTTTEGEMFGPTLFPPKKPKTTTPPSGPTVKPPEVMTVPGTNIECGFSNASHTRIIGGQEAHVGAWPWMAALGYKDKDTGGVNFLCGGALVSQSHVVTASHCVHNRDDLAVVRLGDHNLFSDDDGVKPIDIPIGEVIKNPNYNPTTFQNDIAVLKLKQQVPLSMAVHPICLPYTPDLKRERFEDKTPFVAGWGAIQFNGPSSATLREVQLPVVDDEECQEKYKPFKTSKVDDTNICAGFQRGGKDACQGDSGGPLMYPVSSSRYILIGVVSYGFRCAEPGFPGVYSRVTSHTDWIIDTMKKTP